MYPEDGWWEGTLCLPHDFVTCTPYTYSHAEITSKYSGPIWLRKLTHYKLTEPTALAPGIWCPYTPASPSPCGCQWGIVWGREKAILLNSCQNICIFGRISFFLRLGVSEKLLEKLKITVKQEGNTRQPAVPSEQKARQPGCEVLCWDSRTLRESCQLFNCLGTKIKGGEVGGRDNRKPGVAAVSQLMTYKAHCMLVPPAITKARTDWDTCPKSPHGKLHPGGRKTRLPMPVWFSPLDWCTHSPQSV